MQLKMVRLADLVGTKHAYIMYGCGELRELAHTISYPLGALMPGQPTSYSASEVALAAGLDVLTSGQPKFWNELHDHQYNE